jgi:putative intracellular protease/amidase
MSPPRRALISVTSASASLFDGKETTGLFIVEALHPYNVLTAAGFQVDLASETGSYTPDWLSQQPDFLGGDDLSTWNDLNSDFRKKLDNMPKASELDGSQYGLFFASAGHASLIDYPTASSLQKIASQVWANGGVVASVCHGPAIFANLIDPATNEPLIKGKKITGFTTEAENTMKIMSELRSWNAEMVEETALRLGAECTFLCELKSRDKGRVANYGFIQTYDLRASGTIFTSLMDVSSLARTLRAASLLPMLPCRSLTSCRWMRTAKNRLDGVADESGRARHLFVHDIRCYTTWTNAQIQHWQFLFNFCAFNST